jgi:hypothetical protein
MSRADRERALQANKHAIIEAARSLLTDVEDQLYRARGASEVGAVRPQQKTALKGALSSRSGKGPGNRGRPARGTSRQDRSTMGPRHPKSRAKTQRL